MGADLITIIVKGPASLNERTRAEAVAHVDGVIKAVREVLAKGDDISDKERRQVCQLTGLPDMEEIERAGLAEMQAEKVVDDLFCCWRGDFRDTGSRFDPDDDGQQIVVAGDMSWGDDPDGAGYQALKAASVLGLFEFFGIR